MPREHFDCEESTFLLNLSQRFRVRRIYIRINCSLKTSAACLVIPGFVYAIAGLGRHSHSASTTHAHIICRVWAHSSIFLPAFRHRQAESCAKFESEFGF